MNIRIIKTNGGYNTIVNKFAIIGVDETKKEAKTSLKNGLKICLSKKQYLEVL